MNNNEMLFIDHILELRSRILKVLLSIIICSIFGYLNADDIIFFLLLPTNDPSISLQVLKITSIFNIKLMVSFFFGLTLSFPVLMYQLLSFIVPAFRNNITTYRIIIFIIISLFLLMVGICFGYYVLIPFSINFFKSISLPLLNSVSLNYTLENYLVYLVWILVISSLIYQIPLFMFFIVKMGFIDIKWLRTNRRYVIVVFFILSALFTPPDPISQLMVALPLISLYEITIIIIRLLIKNKDE
tara:strand:- start:1050 stop:1778 length:729 start_codon:yes stop_codon:yes gene_type:complete